MYSRRTLPSGRCRARTYSNNNNIHAGRTADNQLLSRARVPITAFAAVGTPPPYPPSKTSPTTPPPYAVVIL